MMMIIIVVMVVITIIVIITITIIVIGVINILKMTILTCVMGQHCCHYHQYSHQYYDNHHLCNGSTLHQQRSKACWRTWQP